MAAGNDHGKAPAGAAGRRGRGEADTPRAARLKAALRANLARRKAQARARADDGADRGGPDDKNTR